MKKLIIIPAYNESESIEKTVRDIIENAPSFDYVVINDCSTDNTRQICEDNGFNIVNPVSYTHLDVYKRQILRMFILLLTRTTENL